DLLDRVGHVGHRDLQKSRGDPLRRGRTAALAATALAATALAATGLTTTGLTTTGLTTTGLTTTGLTATGLTATGLTTTGLADLPGQSGEALPDDPGVQRLIPAGAEHPGEVLRLDPAQHDVGVRHGQRAATPVGRP